jgi:hypothetical protein
VTVGFTGHQSFPQTAVAYIREEITRELREVQDLEGLTALAAGADQIFAEEVLRAKGKLRAVLPSEGYESTFTDERDLRTFRSLVARCTHVETLDFKKPSEQAYLQAGRRIVELSDRMLAVWDGAHSRGIGGTADIVAYAKSLGRPLTVIWPKSLRR